MESQHPLAINHIVRWRKQRKERGCAGVLSHIVHKLASWTTELLEALGLTQGITTRAHILQASAPLLYVAFFAMLLFGGSFRFCCGEYMRKNTHRCLFTHMHFERTLPFFSYPVVMRSHREVHPRAMLVWGLSSGGQKSKGLLLSTSVYHFLVFSHIERTMCLLHWPLFTCAESVFITSSITVLVQLRCSVVFLLFFVFFLHHFISFSSCKTQWYTVQSVSYIAGNEREN